MVSFPAVLWTAWLFVAIVTLAVVYSQMPKNADTEMKFIYAGVGVAIITLIFSSMQMVNNMVTSYNTTLSGVLFGISVLLIGVGTFYFYKKYEKLKEILNS